MFSGFIHTPFLFVADWYSVVWIYHNFIVLHLWVKRQLGCCYLGTTMNNAPVKFTHKCLCECVFSSLGCRPGAELLGHVTSVFNSWRSCQTVFPKGSYIIWHSCQQSRRGLISPYPCCHLPVFFYYLIYLIINNSFTIKLLKLFHYYQHVSFKF